jgi:hypothetical protein
MAIIMDLHQAFFCLCLRKNKSKYFRCILVTIVCFIVMFIFVFLFYHDQQQDLGSGWGMQSFTITSYHMQLLFCFSGAAVILYRYIHTVYLQRMDYGILRGMGAARNFIRQLIVIQLFFIIVVIVPVSLGLGMVAVKGMAYLLHKEALNGSRYLYHYFIKITFLLSFSLWGAVIASGVYVFHKISVVSPSQLLYENELALEKGNGFVC